MALMTYTVRDKHGTIYFRRTIPSRLRPFMPAPWTDKRDWKRSLRTKDNAQAKRPYAEALTECVAAFEAAERAQRGETAPHRPQVEPGSITPEEIEADFLASLLAEDERERGEGDARRHLQTPAERQQWPDLEPVTFGRKAMAEDLWSVEAEEELEPLLADYRRALARSAIKIIEPELRDYLRKRGVPIEPNSERYYQAGLAVLRAHVRAYEGMLARHRGEIVETPKPASGKGPKLSEAFGNWKAGSGARGAKKPSPRTLQEAEHAVRRFTEWHGDIRLGAINKEKAREFRDAIAKLPTRLPREELRKSLRALLKVKHDAGLPVHASTVNKLLQMLSAIVAHAVKEGTVDHVQGFSNPFSGIKLVVDKRDEEEREPFDAADLKAIFGTGVFTKGERPKAGGGEAAFWLPLIGLLSGARLGEIAQLRITDLRQDAETAIWFFDIGTAGGRSIKTASSRRQVPMHPALDSIGLLRYRQSLLEGGAGLEGSLWRGIASAVEGQKAAAWSKWFGRFLRKEAGITDPNKVFHSFRHTFKRMLRDTYGPGVEEISDALTGHSGSGVGRKYGSGFGLKAKADVVEGLKVPEVVEVLRWAA